MLIIFVLLLQELSPLASSETLPSKNDPGIERQSKFVVSNIPKFDDNLASQQVETIRQIIAAEQKNRQTYAQTKEISNFPTSKGAPDQIASFDKIPTLEELKAQCQHFSKLFSVKHVEANDGSSTTESEAPTSGTLRPIYIRNKPTFIQKKNGFFVTVQPIEKDFSSTRRPFQRSSTTLSTTTTTTEDPSSNTFSTNSGTINMTSTPAPSRVDSTKKPSSKVKVKYTRLEPVILQKTILTDGRVLYHWHKALPTSLFDLPVAETPLVQPLAPLMDLPTYTPPDFGKPQTETTTDQSTTTTTTEESSWLFVPFRNFFSGGYSDEEPTTTEKVAISSTNAPRSTPPSTTTSTPSTTSPTTTTFAPSTNGYPPEELKYQEQLKFVVPVQYGDIDQQIAHQRKPWDYHRFAYYPKELQPTNAMGSPPLPIIKSVVVPKFNLAYASGGYGLSYPRQYGAGYDNYQRYDGPMSKELDDVSIE